ncbi:TonB-dependent receptor plug domain-containing protein [Nitrosophilus alvini]|uniref:TonB-dependent receptor plug domain-containing protein n=1 Tax=Nitrosophilus alvini TaxID=2714855 RepID=UPI00190DE748|nr:TonB-dependent receptor [Nitrosophilus alvini]
MCSKFKFLMITAIVLLNSRFVYAEEPDKILTQISGELEKYKEVATKTKENIHYQPFIISVYEGKELEKLGITNLKEALELVPGVDMATDNIDNKTPIFRGSNPFAYGQSKLIIDGVVVNDLMYDGYSNYLYMPIEVIKRIEVVRGPGSKTDGVNAYAGSINVITYAEEFKQLKNKDTLFIKAGSYNYKAAGFVKNYKKGDLKIYTDFYYQKDNKKLPIGYDGLSQGIFGDINKKLSRSGKAPLWLRNYSLGITAKYHDFTLKARTLYYKHGSAYGINAILPEDEDFMKFPSNYMEISYDKKRKNIETVLKAGIKFDSFYSQSKLAPDGFVLPSLSNPSIPVPYPNGFYGIHEAKQRTFYHSSFLKYTGIDKHKLTFGYYLSKEETYKVVTKTTDRDTGTGLVDYSDSYPFFDEDAKRYTYIISFQDKYDYSDKLSLSYGLNYENNTHIKGQLNPRVSFVYLKDSENIFKAMYSRSHRNPSWQELYTKNNRARRGNPDLKPEIVHAFETAYIKKFSADSYMQANLFYLINKDQINKANAENEYRNAMDTDIYGLELEYKGNITHKDLIYMTYSYVDGKDNEDHHLANVAKHMIKGYYLYNITSKVAWSLTGKYVGSKERVYYDNRDELDPYYCFDTSLRYRNYKKKYTLQFSVKNMFNNSIKYPSEPYTYYDDYPQEGRNYMFTFKKEF